MGDAWFQLNTLSCRLFLGKASLKAGCGVQNAGEDAIKRMRTGGIPVGKKESQDLAWERVFKFFQAHLG